MQRFALHSVISAGLKILFPSHDALKLSIQLHDLGSCVVDVAIAVSLLSLLGGIEHATMEVSGVIVQAFFAEIGGPRLTLGNLLRVLGANDDLVIPLTFVFILRIELLLHRGAELKEDKVVLLTSHNKEKECKSIYLSYNINPVNHPVVPQGKSTLRTEEEFLPTLQSRQRARASNEK